MSASENSRQAELVVVTGGPSAAGRHGAERVIATIRAQDPATAVIHHDLAELDGGVVRRRLQLRAADQLTELPVPPGAVWEALAGDLLPLLRALGRREQVRRIVVHLDSCVSPAWVCTAIREMVVAGAPVTDAVALRGVVAVVDLGSWLTDAVSADRVVGRGLPRLPGADPTMAALVVGQAEFADLLVCAGAADLPLLACTDAALARLNPLAPRLPLAQLDSRVMLAGLPAGARRGVADLPHAALLRGQPPLHAEAGARLRMFTARRPFHPGRLHTAIDVLLNGVVRTRGRIWLATRPDAALWLESAGGGLQIGHLGDWLAAGDPAVQDQAWRQADPERRVQAALRWHERWGDRAQELAILTHDVEHLQQADPESLDTDRIDTALRAALLSDRELAAGPLGWARYPDPFGHRHSDPCQPAPSLAAHTPAPGHRRFIGGPP